MMKNDILDQSTLKFLCKKNFKIISSILFSVVIRFGIPYEINYNLIDAIALNVAFLPNVFETLYDPGSILLVLWSIGIEEQFYLFTAPILAVLAIHRYTKGLLLFTLIYFVFFTPIILPFLKSIQFIIILCRPEVLLLYSVEMGIDYLLGLSLLVWGFTFYFYYTLLLIGFNSATNIVKEPLSLFFFVC
ncbi:hypothetical protein [Labilibaculum sp.]|uniref:hypothetical protein n=1 Tax=Labilibaculum sp. TaxID=2060723 RepID=UPI0035694BCA